MSLAQHQTDHQRCLQLAAELLGEPARAFGLDWDLQRSIEPLLKLDRRCGATSHHPLVCFRAERPGHELQMGLERFRLALEGREFRLVRVEAPLGCGEGQRFWAVASTDYLRLFRALMRRSRRELAQHPPIMREQELDRLWCNTIGFLRHGAELLSRYRVPQKRGVLLLGEPGNGKTMACRWLRHQCIRMRFAWRSVTAEEFAAARQESQAHELFQLDRPGIVFFDDVDMAVRDRGQFDQTSDHATFLGGLDGLEVHRGVVYLFTSNARLASLDPAFLRPGRIDVVMTFARPDAGLRRRLIETWHGELLAALDIESVVAETEGLSFAELEECKKLLVLNFVERGVWDWPAAWSLFQQGRGPGGSRMAIGFNANPPNQEPALARRAAAARAGSSLGEK
ncbi:MAG TPA: ATP-binding protein [Pirellulales bacterium]|nr:ATP-binding protein [Pirellulales bacterium]